jgi:hypothetical protein
VNASVDEQQIERGERRMTTTEKMSKDGRAAEVERGERKMATCGKESNMKSTASKLIRLAGLAALVAGIIFAGIQPVHPPDVLASVTTGAWAIIMPLKLAMCLLFLIGIAGIYARQVERAGWLGLTGFLLLTFCWWLQSAYVFAETFILPQLATAAPPFVVSFLGIASGNPGAMNIEPLPAIYSLGIGIPYMLGGLLFGIATLRAGVLPRWPAALLAVAATLTPLAALLPHEIQRLAAIPVGLALAWLGYALLSERRAQASDPATGGGNSHVG